MKILKKALSHDDKPFFFIVLFLSEVKVKKTEIMSCSYEPGD